MNIKDLIDKYRVSSSSLRDAQNLAAEEIVLSKIATSEMTEHITLKGGIVMYNLARSDRRVTKDIDFDFIRYSIEKESINAFIKKSLLAHD
ncbi:MAG: nucleotidyl transferase AbiEii/AbiGii toxin family protein [Bacilli bacterium]|nr:nucleotidyl transferase AbiEii/AbiGii toxin family protein [Bacilli bacterium]